MPAWLETARFGLTLLVMLVSLLGLLIPVFPGNEIIWLTALVYGLLSGFQGLGLWMFLAITLLAIVATVADTILINAGAARGGASWLSITAGIIAGFAGTFLFPPIGGLIGAPLAVFAVEGIRRNQAQESDPWGGAWRALRGMAAGWGMALVVRFGLGVLMIICWVLWDWLA
jgi:uncharacterized protein YqgC (DUF456 family)